MVSDEDAPAFVGEAQRFKFESRVNDKLAQLERQLNAQVAQLAQANVKNSVLESKVQRLTERVDVQAQTIQAITATAQRDEATRAREKADADKKLSRVTQDLDFALKDAKNSIEIATRRAVGELKSSASDQTRAIVKGVYEERRQELEKNFEEAIEEHQRGNAQLEQQSHQPQRAPSVATTGAPSHDFAASWIGSALYTREVNNMQKWVNDRIDVKLSEFTYPKKLIKEYVLIRELPQHLDKVAAKKTGTTTAQASPGDYLGQSPTASRKRVRSDDFAADVGPSTSQLRAALRAYLTSDEGQRVLSRARASSSQASAADSRIDEHSSRISALEEATAGGGSIEKINEHIENALFNFEDRSSLADRIKATETKNTTLSIAFDKVKREVDDIKQDHITSQATQDFLMKQFTTIENSVSAAEGANRATATKVDGLAQDVRNLGTKQSELELTCKKGEQASRAIEGDLKAISQVVNQNTTKSHTFETQLGQLSKAVATQPTTNTTVVDEATVLSIVGRSDVWSLVKGAALEDMGRASLATIAPFIDRLQRYETGNTAQAQRVQEFFNTMTQTFQKVSDKFNHQSELITNATKTAEKTAATCGQLVGYRDHAERLLKSVIVQLNTIQPSLTAVAAFLNDDSAAPAAVLSPSFGQSFAQRTPAAFT